MEERRITADVLIVGCGPSGMWTAKRLKEKKPDADVLIVDKGPDLWGGLMSLSGGDFEAVFPEEDVQSWIRDLVWYWDGLCDQAEMTDIFSDSYARMCDYQKLGYEFLKNEQGEYMPVPQRSMEHCRLYPCKEKGTGGQIMAKAMVSEMLRLNVRHMCRTQITSLVKVHDKVIGAVGFDSITGDFLVFEAKAVVVACGNPSWKPGYNGNTSTGEWVKMCLEAGAKLRNFESLTVMNAPKLFFWEGQGIYLALGARFVNAQGEPFMERYSPVFGANTDNNFITRAMAMEMKAGRGPIYLDLSQIPEEDMRLGGQWTFEGHAYPGHMRTHLKYDGHDQKKILTRQALERGVTILNKMPVTEFLTGENGAITGAVAIDIAGEKPVMQLIQAKALITATGSTNRIYSSCTPGWMFNVAGCPANAGGGVAAGYRAGAALVNMDIPGIPAGPKYFSRAGKGTWIGVLRDYNGNAVGPFVEKPSREHGDITSDVWPSVFRDKAKNGSGPVYMDCTELSEADMQYLYWAFTTEGDTSLVEAMETQGIDLRTHMVEFGSYECTLLGRGLQIDENARTNVPGLYAVGDHVGNFLSHIAGAATMGRIAGEHAAQYAAHQSFAGNIATGQTVARCQQFYSQLLRKENGAGWKELNITVNQLMDDYASTFSVRSETMLQAGIEYFAQLRQRAAAEVSCSTAHELMRALEAFDLLELGEAVCRSAMERKETRGLHNRTDYPFTNPLLNNHFVTIQKTPDGPKTDMRPAKTI